MIAFATIDRSVRHDAKRLQQWAHFGEIERVIPSE
jgi:hypothetical protein